jgi:hypothetical protein
MKGGIRKAFKTSEIKDRSLFIHPLTMMIMAEMIHWAQIRGIPVSITETLTTEEEDSKLKRVSSSHREGRAFDISTRGWTEDQIKLFTEDFSKKYASLAATGSSGNPALIVRHDTGRGDHFHVQINRKWALIKPMEEA